MIGLDNSIDNADRTAAVVVLGFEVSEELIGGTYQQVDYVTWCRRGNTRSVNVEKVRVCKKNDPVAWSVIGPAYDAWKRNEATPIEGTPIVAWPGIPRKMADRIVALGFRSVEDLALATDADLEHIGMGARKHRDSARAFVQNKRSAAPLAAAIAEKDEEIAGLRDRLASLEALVRRQAEAVVAAPRAPRTPRPSQARVVANVQQVADGTDVEVDL